MLRLPSIQKQYDEYWSCDPAFVQLGENATDAEREEYASKLRHARRTGDWSGLLIEGQTPTKFVMQPIRGEQWRWLVDEARREDEFSMGPAKYWQLMFRCACVSVKNAGIEIPDKPVKHRNLGMIAPSEMTDTLDSIDPSIVTELANAAFKRAQNLDPL